MRLTIDGKVVSAPGPERAHGVVPRAVLTAGSGLAFLQGLIDGVHPPPPFSRATLIYLTSVAEGRAVFTGVPSEAFLNPIGTVHGGWSSALLDSARLVTRTGASVLPSSGELTCEGRVIHRGGTLATSEGKLLDAAGKLLAHGTETCMIIEAKG